VFAIQDEGGNETDVRDEEGREWRGSCTESKRRIAKKEKKGCKLGKHVKAKGDLGSYLGLNARVD